MAGAPSVGAQADGPAAPAANANTKAPLGLIALNLGGPTSLYDVEPFLRRLFGDPSVTQLGWLRPLQPLLARSVARSRASGSLL